MRPQLLKVCQEPRHSFSVSQDPSLYFNNRKHYHKEVELIYFKKGEGTLFIGDRIKKVRAGNIVLIGSNLPHFIRFENVRHHELNEVVDARVIHFSKDFWGSRFLELPENDNIRELLDKSKRGVLIESHNHKEIADLIEVLLQTEIKYRIIYLMQILNLAADCEQLEVLTSIGFKHKYSDHEMNRIEAVYAYSLKNFKRNIQLEEIASVANISPTAFCRFFKSKTKKTYSQFLNELRIRHACELIAEKRLSMKQLCYESGFNNFTSFHKNFKQVTNKSPKCYQREIMG